jgi:hypothetical protein
MPRACRNVADGASPANTLGAAFANCMKLIQHLQHRYGHVAAGDPAAHLRREIAGGAALRPCTCSVEAAC